MPVFLSERPKRSVVPQRPPRDRPPAGLALRQLALELAHVQRQLSLLAVEPLLELGQLGAPALDALLAELDVGLELGLARLERILALVDVAQASLELLLDLPQALLARREPDLLGHGVARASLQLELALVEPPLRLVQLGRPALELGGAPLELRVGEGRRGRGRPRRERPQPGFERKH